MPKKKSTSPALGLKPILDYASGRWVVAGEEEINATQPLLEMLIDELGWSKDQIQSRPQWRVKAAPSDTRKWPVDVVLFDDPAHAGDPEHLSVICECKKPTEESGIEQLKIYMQLEPAVRLGIWFNGTDHRILYRKADGTIDLAPVGTPIPRPTDPLMPVGAKTRTIADLRKVGTLAPVIKRIRGRIAAQDSRVNRDEEMLPDITNLLLLKLEDELERRSDASRPLSFQAFNDDDAKTAKHMKDLLAQHIKAHPDVYVDAEARFAIDDASIAYIVRELQDIKFLGTGADLILQAFEVLRGHTARGEEGQFNTPSNAVNLAIAALNPQPHERFIDPAGGAGSFAAKAEDHVLRLIEANMKLSPEDKVLLPRDYVKNKVFVLDKDAVSVRLAKAQLGMLSRGEGTNVFKVDSTRPKSWPERVRTLCADGSFDVIATNPPFGTNLKVPVQVAREEKYEVCLDWKLDKKGGFVWKNTGQYVERDIGIVFLERCIRLLAPGGRMAIVLPDTYLFSESYGWLVQWLKQFHITHSLAIPIELFEPSCRAKTSILVIKNEKPGPDAEVIGACGETFGRDKHDKPRFKFHEGVFLDGTNGRARVLDDDLTDAAALLLSPPKDLDRLHFTFRQDEAVRKGVLVAPYFWRKPTMDTLDEFARTYDCDLVTVAELIADGELTIGSGHGSPSSHYTGRGTVPYVKVTDIKDGRVNFNPMYAVPEHVAVKFTGAKVMKPFDLLMPTRASKSIGMFGVLMPWQTNCILTREIAVWRVPEAAKRVSWPALLMLSNLRPVFDQYKHLVLMQMNREDLNNRHFELVLPLPRKQETADSWFQPVRDEVLAIVKAREAREAAAHALPPELFVSR